MDIKKIPIYCALLIIGGTGCKRTLSHDEVETELKKAMALNFYKAINYDSSRVKFDAQSVTYFEDKDFYECEFKVKLTERGHDTTGIMTARISKDFSIVRRKQ